MAVPSVTEISTSPSTQSRLPSTSHRLPAVSASQALRDLQSNGSSFIKTGLTSLDVLLSGSTNATSGGIERGKVTELWGPSGGGKTAIALQTAANVMKGGSTVVWIDAATPLSGQRMQAALARKHADNSGNELNRLRYLTMPTLSHLLAMTLHPRPSFLPPKTGLLVVDGLNTLVDLDYPRFQFATSTKTEQQKWQAGRRYAVLGALVSAINKLAVLNNFAVIVTTGCATRMRSDSGLGAALVPGLGGAEWEGGTWNRLVVFRDFGGRFIGVQKRQGKSFISREEVGEVGRVFGFSITADGAVNELPDSNLGGDGPTQRVKPRPSPVRPRKRTFDEVADSDGEDVDEYGWAGTDDDVVATEGLIDDGQIVEGGTKSG